MKRFLLRTLTALFVLCTAGHAAQLTPQQQLYQVSVLVDRAHFADAIAAAEALIQSGTLSGVDLARAWNFLGLAYDDAGEWMKSRHAFEEAAHLFEEHPENAADLADVLNNFMSLYDDMKQPEEAMQMGLKALHLFEQSGDHAGISKACNNLASLELGLKRIRESRRYMQRAFQEMKLAGRLDDDEMAALYSNQASLDMRAGDADLALSGFEKALNLWRNRDGEDHPRTGVGYVLLGNAHIATGNTDAGLREIQHGIAILNHTLGTKNATTLTAGFALARALEANGDRSQAALTRSAAQQGLLEISRGRCSGCTISAEAFR